MKGRSYIELKAGRDREHRPNPSYHAMQRRARGTPRVKGGSGEESDLLNDAKCPLHRLSIKEGIARSIPRFGS